MKWAVFASVLLLSVCLLLLSYAADREITLRAERAALTRIPAQSFAPDSEAVFSSKQPAFKRNER
jgi:hypothetical protein